MNDSEKTIPLIDSSLARLTQGDQSAWDDLYLHAFHRLLELCSRVVRQQLGKPNPLITENAVLAATYERLRKAMENENVNPATAREFFGLASRNIRWQVQDMLRKRSEKQAATDLFAQLTEGVGRPEIAEESEKWELFWDAIDTLSDDEREVFDLVWINGLSQYEAAETIGKSRNQVDTIWRRVKRKIVLGCKDYDHFGS